MNTGVSQSPRIYHCSGIKNAYYFDNEELHKKSFASLLLWRLRNLTNDALVSLRLFQYYAKKQEEITSCANLRSGVSSSAVKTVIPILIRSNPISALWYCWYYLLAKREHRSLYKNYGLEISPGALIGKNFKGVFRNVAITNKTKIGENVRIEANVTIAPSKGGPPIIEDDVQIHTGAVIFGSINIGKGSVIGANSLVLKSVEPYSTVVGVPAKPVFRRNKK
jgi:serine acetyltransferase